MRLLLVEDEKKLAAFIKKGLEKKCGHAVDVIHDGEEGLLYGGAVDYDLIILDIMLPRKDGFTVLRELRSKGVKTPILLLTAKATIESKVEGLDSGSDDYLTKPFDLRELVSRVNVLLRRNSVAQPVQLTIADLTLDPVKRIARRGDRCRRAASGGRPCSATSPRDLFRTRARLNRVGSSSAPAATIPDRRSNGTHL